MNKNESDVVKTIKRIMPAVVSIVITKSLKDLEKELALNPVPLVPFGIPQIKIPEEDIDKRGMVKVGGGSGFLVESNGIVVTNKHVVSDSRAEYTIFTSDGEKHGVEILARDPIDDVAILRINAKEVPIVSLGDSSKVELGQSVLAIGNALGLFRNTVSLGIISGLSRSISAQADPKSPMTEMRGLIQTDAAINPGNSGGPLVDMDGRAVGINAAIVYGAQNMGFSIPINVVHRDLDDLRKFGRVRRPLLGLRYVTVDENVGEKLDLAVSYGALVVGSNGESSVIPHSPAALAGLRDKDIILECNGEKITKEKTIQDFLENCAVGDALDLRIRRGVKDMSVKVVLTERK